MYNYIGRIYRPTDVELDVGGADSLLKIRYKTYFGGESFLLLHLAFNKEFLCIKFEQDDRFLPIYIKKSKAQAIKLHNKRKITLVNDGLLESYYSKVFKNKKIKIENDTKVSIGLVVEKFNLEPASVKEAFYKENTFINIEYLLDVDNEKDYFVIEFNEKDNLQIFSNSNFYILD